jgi:hypothetical protein
VSKSQPVGHRMVPVAVVESPSLCRRRQADLGNFRSLPHSRSGSPHCSRDAPAQAEILNHRPVPGEVRCGSNSEIGARNRHIRFPPDSDQTADIAGGPFRAQKRKSRALLDVDATPEDLCRLHTKKAEVLSISQKGRHRADRWLLENRSGLRTQTYGRPPLQRSEHGLSAPADSCA